MSDVRKEELQPRHYFEEALAAIGPPLLYGIRLWASVCLALYVAFWLELDNAYWVGTSAAIVCQPQLGASLRKGWFRMIGTVIGAVVIVLLTAGFLQDRIAYLGLLALWGAVCAFAATLLKNFASYAAALAGFTAVIIASDTLGATGGASTDVFMFAVWRASEICIGIACAGVVLAGTDLGGARRLLAAAFVELASAIYGRFTIMLLQANPSWTDWQTERRDFVRRVIALDPEIDQAIGESSQVRYKSATLQAAAQGLFNALSGWRAFSTHLRRLPDEMAQQATENIRRTIAVELHRIEARSVPRSWMADPGALCRAFEDAAARLRSLPADLPSLRLLADEAASVLAGLSQALNGVSMLVGGPSRNPPARSEYRVNVPDWMPAILSAVRAFITIGAVELFWIVTAWPNGASAIVFATIVVLVLSPRGQLAYSGALTFALGTTGSVFVAAIVKFAVLPSFVTFPAFCAVIGLFLVPAGFALARSRQPETIAIFSAMTFNFLPLLGPANLITYDTVQFYNMALAIVVGCGVAPLSFRLLPPLSPALTVRRLLSRTLRDLRRLAVAAVPPRLEDWEDRLYARSAALPDETTPLQRAQLLTALSVGTEFINLRNSAAQLGSTEELEATLEEFANGRNSIAIGRFAQLDRLLGDRAVDLPDAGATLRARGRIIVISEALSEHAPYFDQRDAP